MKRLKYFLILFLISGGLFITSDSCQKVLASNLATFESGKILSDYQMGNYKSMSETEIQKFLTSKNPCSNTNHNYYLQLSANKNYKWHWSNGHFVCLSEEKFGDGETIGSGQTAAHIIWQAAQDYKINPQVIIVLLQKETGLITDPIPNNGDYRKATGYGCPDTAACSSKYYGFKNQVRNAAKLFREVMDGGWTNYPIGNNYIRYNPKTTCGGTVVNVQNRATSALYRYTPYQPNAAALKSSYGTGDACSAYGNRNFYSYFQDWFGDPKDEGRPSLEQVLTTNRVNKVSSDLEFNYQSHIEEYGWLPWAESGEMAGTAGYALQMEAIRIKLKKEVGVEYRTHIENIGWTNYAHDGEMSGTTGYGLRMEAVQIRLIGNLAKLYNIYYRVHIQDEGWMNWVKNDVVAGTTGQAKRIEAVQIKIIKKNTNYGLAYSAHVQDIGWMNWVNDTKTAGTTGKALRVEAVKIKLPSELAKSGDISYKTHVENIGWMKWVKNGETAGTTGKALRVEALQIKLTGNLAWQYDTFYRVHVQDMGWGKWVKNGEIAGTMGRGLRVEAIEIGIVKK